MPARRLPDKVRQLHGLPQRHVPMTPSIRHAAPRPPAFLPPRAKVEWKRIIQETKGYPGWIQAVDRAALACYCTEWAVFEEAAKDVMKRGILVAGRSSADTARDGDSVVKNPSLSVMQAAQQAMRHWCRELGITPDSRSKIDIHRLDDLDDDSDLDTGLLS